MSLSKRKISIIQYGFSLIELLVVVAIIGVLAGLGIIGYNSYIEYTRAAVNEANARKLAAILNAERVTSKYCSGTGSPNPINKLSKGSASTDNYINCVNYLLATNSFTNPYTGQPYGAQNSQLFYPDKPIGPNTMQAPVFPVWFGGTLPTQSTPIPLDCASCTDDVGGLIIVKDNSSSAIDGVDYIGTCSNTDPNFPWQVVLYSAFILY
jgi:prepilin-type N-terminal cleavage/methylation domain-containing protein